jgi:hypothetical protein
LRSQPELSGPRPDSGLRLLGLALAVCIGSALAHVGTATMPYQVGALIEARHRTAAEAGTFGLFEVAPLALSMMLAGPLLRSFSPAVMGISGAALSAAGFLGVFLLNRFWMELVCAGLSGLGLGLVFTAVVAAAAASDRADRLYGVGNAGALLIILAIMASIPIALRLAGGDAVFVWLAALAVVCAPCMLGLAYRARTVMASRPPPAVKQGVGLLITWSCISLGTTALYAFSTQIGKALRLPDEQLGTVLMSGVVVGMLGAGTAALFGGRMNRVLALFLGVCGCAASCVLIGGSTGLLSYTAGIYLYWLAYMFLYSALQGTASMLDESGSLGALGGGCERLGYALGAWAGGVGAEHLSFRTIGVLGAGLSCLGFLVSLPQLRAALTPMGSAKHPMDAPQVSVDPAVTPGEIGVQQGDHART